MSVAQTVKELKRKPLDFLSFIYQNIALLTMIVSGYLAVRFVIACLSVYPKRKKKFPFDLFYLTDRAVMRRLPKVAILVLTFSWFQFILVSCLTSSIKTTKVVIDTSFLIDSLQKIESTTRKPVFLGELMCPGDSTTNFFWLPIPIFSEIELESDYKIISGALKGTLLYRLFHRKLERRSNFFLLRTNSLAADMLSIYKSTDQSFLFMSRFPLSVMLNIVSTFFSRVFFNHHIYYESLGCVRWF